MLGHKRKQRAAQRQEARNSAEQRIVRLAVLLLANESQAVALIRRVLGPPRRHQDLADLHPANLDRLVVLRSREVRETPVHAPSALVFAGDAGRLLGALHALNGQSMEAWIFTHVEGHDLRRVSRTMDCSTTAIGRHLELAQETLLAQLGDGVEKMGPALRRGLQSYQPHAVIADVRRAQRLRRRRRRRIAFATCLAALVLVYVVWRVLR